MPKTRLEAFSDGVIAIIITIMVLELKVPHEAQPAALIPLLPVFMSYILSFLFVGIYWNNHHHTLQLVHGVTGAILWANLHLLFWLSLIPFTTSWMGENHFSQWPVALYGLNLLLCAIAYTIFVRALLAHQGPKSKLAQAIGADLKGRISVVFYIVGMALAPIQSWVAYSCYIAVAFIWLVPDRRIEKVIARTE